VYALDQFDAIKCTLTGKDALWSPLRRHEFNKFDKQMIDSTKDSADKTKYSAEHRNVGDASFFVFYRFSFLMFNGCISLEQLQCSNLSA